MTQLRQKMLEELQARKTLVDEQSGIEIKGVSVTISALRVAPVIFMRFRGPDGPKGQGRKITALALGLVQDLVVRSDSRSFGVAGSSSRCAVASIVW